MGKTVFNAVSFKRLLRGFECGEELLNVSIGDLFHFVVSKTDNVALIILFSHCG